MPAKRTIMKMEDVDNFIKVFKDLRQEVISNQNLNLGIAYGLLFGILASLFATIVYQEIIMTAHPIIKFSIELLIIGALLFLFFVMKKEHKRWSEDQKRFTDFIKYLEDYKAHLRRGETPPLHPDQTAFALAHPKK